jgi:hypothetical protein
LRCPLLSRDEGRPRAQRSKPTGRLCRDVMPTHPEYKPSPPSVRSFARDDAFLVSILSFPSLSHPHMNAGFDWSCPLYHCTTIITCRTK